MNAQAPIPQPAGRNRHTDLPVGEILRRTRVHYGRSVEDVEAVLRIRAAHLTALEDGKTADLPGRVYALGFLRSYSEYLGLDGDKMVQLFKAQSGPGKAQPELNFPVAASESKLPGMLLIGTSFAAVIFVVSLVSIFHHHKATRATQEDIPAVASIPKPAASPAVVPASPQMTSAQAAAVAVPTAAAPVQTTATATSGPANAARIVINVKDTTWLEIRNASGKAIISRVLNPGDKYLVPNEDGLTLATGNIGGLDFVVDGKSLPALGAQGDVARGIRLNAETLTGSRSATQTGAVVMAAPAVPQPASPATAAVEEGSTANWRGSIKQDDGTATAQKRSPTDEAYKPRAKARLTPADEAYKPAQNASPSDSDQTQDNGGDPYARVSSGGEAPSGNDPE